MKTLSSGFAAAVALLLFVGTAVAQEEPETPKLLTKVGVSVSAGGGIAGYLGSDMRDFASVGGSWGVRAVAGTRQMFALELGYSGTLGSIDALGLDSDALLLSTSIEGAARFNLLNEEWQPYMFAGMGWRHYDLTAADVNTSSVGDADNVLEVPVGIGVSYRSAGFVGDVRAVVRPAFGGDLVATPDGDNDKANMDSWEGNITLGYEF